MPKLFLIPNAIFEGEDSPLPNSAASAIDHLRLFFVEEPKSARRLLKQVNSQIPLQKCEFLDLNEHTPKQKVEEYLQLLQETDGGIISESGCPCVADPGADLVLAAHREGIDVIPLIGPSSIIMALMASGLNGQNFAFNGYLPKESPESKLKDLQKRALQEGQTQIFMDTPYRNQNMLESVLKACDPNLLLCVALDVGSPEQSIKTQKILEWKKSPSQLPKKPALFIISKSI